MARISLKAKYNQDVEIRAPFIFVNTAHKQITVRLWSIQNYLCAPMSSFCLSGPTAKVTLIGIGLFFHKYVVRSLMDVAVACQPQLSLSCIGSSIANRCTGRRE